MHARITFVAAVLSACGGGSSPTAPDSNAPVTDGGVTDSAPPDAGPYTGARAARLAAHGSRACAITEAGELRCWGSGRAVPTTIMTGSVFTRIALGEGGDCAIRDDASLWCGAPTGTLLQVDGSYKDVAVGRSHRCAITTADALVCWGTGTSGELGTGDRMSYTTPTPISTTVAAWSAVAAGERHTCALDATGALYCWGFASGDADLNAPAPVAVAEGMTFQDLAASNGGTSAVRSDGALFQIRGTTLQQLGMATAWTKYRNTFGEGVHTHHCGLQGTTLFCWGSNWRGQAGLEQPGPTSQSEPQQVGAPGEYVDLAIGNRFSCAIRSADRSVHCFGAASVGQLGDGRTISPRTVPSQVGGAGEWATLYANQQRTCAVKTSGALACWGATVTSPDRLWLDSQLPTPIQPITDGVTDVALGIFHGCARRTTGMLACWGGNSFGEVGNGTTMPATTASDTGLVATRFALGYLHTCATDASDRLHCWGAATYNRLGFASTSNVTMPTLVGTDTWKALAASYSNTCGIRTDGTLHCWGFSFTGFEQLSTATTWTALATTPNDNEYWGINAGVLYRWSGNGGNKVPTAVTGTSGWTTVGANYSHQCGARVDGTMQCLGANRSGELGDGTTTDATTPVQVSGTGWAAVAAGYFHTCGLRTDGTLLCWGANGSGEIGDGTSWSAARVTVQL